MDRTASYKHHQASLLEDQVSVIVEDDDLVRPNDSDDESVTSSPRFGIFANDELMIMDRLEEGNHYYDKLKRSFVAGTGKSGKNINVVAIQKKNYKASVMDVARLEVFKLYASAVANRRGGANIKYGWYCGSRDEICDILKHGFRQFTDKTVSNGCGVCLSPANSPIESIKKSVADSDGLRHVLLCCVLLGNPETISCGSHKGYPSSDRFHSGVDNMLNPKNYVIWEHNMNTHILPAVIISFKGDPIEGEQADIHVSRAVRTPTSKLISLSDLIRQLTDHLSSSKLALIKKQHLAYSRKEISKDVFVRCLRAIAGEPHLLEAVVKLRAAVILFLSSSLQQTYFVRSI